MINKNKGGFKNRLSRAKKKIILDISHAIKQIFKKQKTNYDICLAIDSKTREEVKQLRIKIYHGKKGVYPKMDLDNDALDDCSLILFTRDIDGNINSTARLAINGEKHGFPQDEFLSEYRKHNRVILELGRFIILDNNAKLLETYFRAFYGVAKNLQCNLIVMSLKQKNLSLLKRILGIKVLAKNIENYGSKHKLDAVIWTISKTRKRFFKWSNKGCKL